MYFCKITKKTALPWRNFAKESIADGDLAKTKEEYETVKSEYIQLEEALDKHTQNLEECRETLSADKVKLNQQEGDIKVLEEQINAVRQSELYYREQIENYRAKVSELESEQEEHRAKTKEFEDKLQQMEQSVRMLLLSGKRPAMRSHFSSRRLQVTMRRSHRQKMQIRML